MEGWMLTVVTFVLAWWQNEMHPYLRPGNEQTAEARIQDRQEKATFAKAGVRRRRIHMQVQKRTSSAVWYLFMGHYIGTHLTLLGLSNAAMSDTSSNDHTYKPPGVHLLGHNRLTFDCQGLHQQQGKT
jgi:hypothetical protein